MTQTSFTTCCLCEANCGIAVQHDAGRVLSVRGDDEDPLSRGHVCPKAVALMDVHHDPDRLKRPMKRTPGGWKQIGWDEALDETADRLAAIQALHGRDAVAIFVGNPTVHSYTALLSGVVMLGTVGTRNLFTSNSVDALPRQLTSLLLYGSQAVLPIPDIDRTQHMLVLGANPLVSNGSIMTAPDYRRRLQALRSRGGKLVVVDPRRTETAEAADEHHFIRPGTDALLLLGMLQTIFKLGSRAPAFVDGLDEIERRLSAFTPERVAPHTGIDAETIRRLAQQFHEAPSAVCYGRLGTCTQQFGTLTTWLIDVLNLATGNFDREGGAMFPTPAVDLADLAAKAGQSGSFARYRSRVGGLPEFNGEFPVAALAEEIEREGPGQVRALITNAGNPVLSLPNGPRTERALEKLDFMVSIDIYLNETSRLADIILPPTFGLEHEHFALVFHALAVENTVKYSPAVLTKDPDARHDHEIVTALCTRLMRRRGIGGKLAAAVVEWASDTWQPKDVLSLATRIGPYGGGLFPDDGALTFDKVAANPHGLHLGPLVPRLPGALKTEGKRVRLAQAAFLDELAHLGSAIDGMARAEKSLLLVGRRHLRSNNSWMHNAQRLVKGPVRCTLIMHPDDANDRDIHEGDTVIVRSRIGEVRLPVEISDEVMRGVVSMPHGWGHHRDGTRLAVASSVAGVSMNDVLDDTLVDRLSGASVLSGAAVTVARA